MRPTVREKSVRWKTLTRSLDGVGVSLSTPTDSLVRPPQNEGHVTEASRDRRLRYYGQNDYASYWQVDDAFEVIRGFDVAQPFATATDAIESFNAQQFVNAGFLPRTLSDDDRKEQLEPGASNTVAK